MRFFLALLCAFIFLPWLELYILFAVNEVVGPLNTIALIILTGILGAGLARWQGFQVLMRVQRSLKQGTVPALDLLDGFLILCAALVLVTPGLLTDAVGFLLLIPPARRLMRGWLLAAFRKRFDTRRTKVHFGDHSKRPADGTEDDVIEVTAREVRDDEQ